jgi:hypothetical protein
MLTQNINEHWSTVITQLVTEHARPFIIVCLCRLLCHMLPHKAETWAPLCFCLAYFLFILMHNIYPGYILVRNY